MRRGGWALVSVLLGAGSPARSQVAVSVDHVLVRGGGRHEALVSVTGADGAPAASLRAADFRVRADGRGVEELEVRPFSERYAALHVFLVADPELAAGDAAALGGVLRALAAGAGPRDRLAATAAGGGGGALAAPLTAAESIRERLSRLAGAAGDAGVVDAVYAAAQRAARLGSGEAGLVLLVTRGRRPEGRHGLLAVIAAARARGRAAPVSVVLLEDAGTAPSAERLDRLAQRSGGSLRRCRGEAGLAEAAALLVARQRGGYVLRFRHPRWEGGQGRHELAVSIERAGLAAATHAGYEAAEATVPGWWSTRAPWTGAALILLALAAALLLRRRLVFRLRVASGEERGCRYEVFALPLTLGAAEGNDLTLADPRISRSHAVFEARGRAVELLDLNSENGTFVNGERIARRRLQSGDEVSMGGAVAFIFEGRG